MDNVIVTQADRDAAVAWARLHLNWTGHYRDSVKQGHQDKNWLVLALARHRTEATRQLEADKAELVEFVSKVSETVTLLMIELQAEWGTDEGDDLDLLNLKAASEVLLEKHGGNHVTD